MNNSINDRIISEGKLSTQKYPSSSKAAMAVDFPAPENPVMMTRSVSADPAIVVSFLTSDATVFDASIPKSLTRRADKRENKA